jgi:hypothetical protein
MAKTKISEYSATSANNTDISNINIAEGCSPANVNNAIRTLMAQLKDQQDGTSGDPFTVGGNLTVTGTTTLTTVLPVTSGGTGASTDTGARTALSAAKSGANSDITSITGLTTPLTIAQGGTGTASTTFANLTTNVTGTLPVANGGTGATTLTSGSVIVGAGTSTPTFVAPTTTGNVLFTTNGTSWSSTPKITSATAQATTSGTNIDFTSIPSWVKRITVLFNGVSTSSSSQVQVRIGAGSIQATGYLSTSWQGGSGDSGSIYTTGFGIDASSGSSAWLRTGQLVITNISGNIWIGAGVIARQPGVSDAVWALGGNVTLSGTLDRLTITTTNGTDTFDAGSINIMYE